jgi:hypothetical protein
VYLVGMTISNEIDEATSDDNTERKKAEQKAQRVLDEWFGETEKKPQAGQYADPAALFG